MNTYKLASVLFVALVDASCGWTAEAAEPIDERELQLAFARAENLSLVTSLAELPTDGQKKLAHLAEYGSLADAAQPLADMGGEWSPSDAKIEGLPRGQHLFSAVSDQILAILFVTGGVEIEYSLMLARRHASSYCLIRLTPLHPSNLRLSVIQQFVHPGKDRTQGPPAKCEVVKMNDILRG